MMEKEKRKLPEEEKKQGKISRREFLKDAGLVVGGAALGSTALAGACKAVTTTTETTTATITSPLITNQAQTTTTTVTPPTITQTVSVPRSGYIAYDATKCACCGRCMEACMVAHEGGTSYTLSSIKWFEDKWLHGYDGEVPDYPMFCQQCDAPSCYAACPLKDKALCIDPVTGARYINKANCIGCGICVTACPLSPPRVTVDPAQAKAIKCDLCKDRKVFLVDDIKLTSPGSGYTTDPKVTISAPSGSGTTATAVAKIGNPAGTDRHHRQWCRFGCFGHSIDTKRCCHRHHPRIRRYGQRILHCSHRHSFGCFRR
jgi:Fe-S-cluster-containing dehydrogenase component